MAIIFDKELIIYFHLKCLIFINNLEKLRESLQNLQNDLEKPKKVKDVHENKNNLSLNDSLSVLIDHFIESIIKNQVVIR